MGGRSSHCPQLRTTKRSSPANPGPQRWAAHSTGVAYRGLTPAGRLVLVQPAHQPVRDVELTWRQPALPDSEGRAFALRLPAADIATCTLDIPAGVQPTSNANEARRLSGPLPGVEAGQTRWVYAGATGPLPIFLGPPGVRSPLGRRGRLGLTSARQAPTGRRSGRSSGPTRRYGRGRLLSTMASNWSM